MERERSQGAYLRVEILRTLQNTTRTLVGVTRMILASGADWVFTNRLLPNGECGVKGATPYRVWGETSRS
jgi:hypothetical protein